VCDEIFLHMQLVQTVLIYYGKKKNYVQEKYHVKQPRKSLKIKVKCKIA
jgi:hypothetical protein